MTGFDPVQVIEVLADHVVEFVIIGGFAAELHGAPIPATQDVDVTPSGSPENLARLPAALDDLGARIRVNAEPEGLVFSTRCHLPWARWGVEPDLFRRQLRRDVPAVGHHRIRRSRAISLGAAGCTNTPLR